MSEPVEDRLYPDVGDPGVDALHYQLDLAWSPQSKTLDGVETLVFRATGDADEFRLDLGEPLTVSALTVDGTAADFEENGKDLVVRAPVVADRRYAVEIQYAGTPAGARAHDPHRLRLTRLAGHRRRRDLDHAGAVRRVHLVRRQRPAVRQGALRLHDQHAVPVGGRRQRPAACRARRSTATP